VIPEGIRLRNFTTSIINAQPLGMALKENFVTKDGYVMTDMLNKRRIPTIDQTPEV